MMGAKVVQYHSCNQWWNDDGIYKRKSLGDRRDWHCWRIIGWPKMHHPSYVRIPYKERFGSNPIYRSYCILQIMILLCPRAFWILPQPPSVPSRPTKRLRCVWTEIMVIPNPQHHLPLCSWTMSRKYRQRYCQGMALRPTKRTTQCPRPYILTIPTLPNFLYVGLSTDWIWYKIRTIRLKYPYDWLITKVVRPPIWNTVPVWI